MVQGANLLAALFFITGQLHQLVWRLLLLPLLIPIRLTYAGGDVR